MVKESNCHEGHRERMTEKFISAQSAMPDHEILEILLFYAIPRKDTNELAHKLIRTFGSLENVLTKTPKELMVVDGIGKRTATYLSVIGEANKRINLVEKKNLKARISFDQYKREFIDYFANSTAESFLFLLLDKKFNEITRLTFSNGDEGYVNVDSPELSKTIAMNKPVYLIAVHNHPSGNPNPSKNDDISTRKLYILCQVHGVTLADHIIVAKNLAYSYKSALRLEYIKETADLNRLIND